MDITTTYNTTWKGMTLTLVQSGTEIPIDITGGSFVLEVKRSFCSTVIMSLSAIVDIPTEGHFYFDKLFIDDTPGTYTHSCKMTLSGDVDEILSGTFTILE